MIRLVAASGVLMVEAAAHALWAGTQAEPGFLNLVLPALVGVGPAIHKTADEWFRRLTEGNGPHAV